MDKIQKALAKLIPNEREQVKNILQRFHIDQTRGFDIAKLKGHDDIFRILKGRLRIIFRLHLGVVYLLKIDLRSDTTIKKAPTRAGAKRKL